MVVTNQSSSSSSSSPERSSASTRQWKSEGVHPPSGYEYFQLQIAGHHSQKGYDERLSVLYETDTGYILKPLQIPPRGDRERNFYANLSEEDKKLDETERELACLTPKYYGCVDLPVSLMRKHSFIRMENLTGVFHKPCLLDVKIGVRTWDPEAGEEKKEYEMKKYPWLEVLGFRFLGMKVYYPSISDFKCKDKQWGKKLPDTEVFSALDFFFVRSERERKFVKAIVDDIIEKLYKILAWFEKQRMFTFYSSSLLIMYEGETRKSTKEASHFTDVKMIDFSHVFPSNGQKDCNYIAGLKTFIEILVNYRKIV